MGLNFVHGHTVTMAFWLLAMFHSFPIMELKIRENGANLKTMAKFHAARSIH